MLARAEPDGTVQTPMPDEPAAELGVLLGELASHVPAAVLRDLESRLRAMDPEVSLSERAEQIRRLAEWLGTKDRRAWTLPEVVPAAAVVPRMWLLCEVLRRSRSVRGRTGQVLRSVLAEASALHLFCDVGLPSFQGFTAEAWGRLVKKVRPAYSDGQELGDLLYELFPNARAAQWLVELPPGALSDFFALLSGPRGELDLWSALAEGMLDAVQVLGLRLASVGLDRDLLERGESEPLGRSPFLQLPLAVQRFVDAVRAKVDVEEARLYLEDVFLGCRRVKRTVRSHLEKYGVSVSLVYRLELIGLRLKRLEILTGLLAGRREDRIGALLAFFQELVTCSIDDRSLSVLLRENVRLLSRKVIERAGQSGEHYITTSRREYHRMVSSAAGGGVVTAGTTIVKFLLSSVAAAPFFSGLFASLNYAISFTAMQLMGFTLATKQPSMTAAALAGTLGETGARTEEDLQPLVGQIAQITRSQLAAVVGNLGAVIPAAVGFNVVWQFLTGEHFLTDEESAYVVRSLDPLFSAAVPYAILTGFLLWLSSLCAGWLDNGFAFWRIPDALARHAWLRKLWGDTGAQRVARFIEHHASGVGGSVSLGFLLGMVPVFASFFGLPLEVRHVTLSTGSLALAGCTLSPHAILESAPFLRAMAGIGLIGLMNFGVSFALALAVALRARGIGWKVFVTLCLTLARRFLREPFSFVFPPRDPRPEPAASFSRRG